MIWLLKLLFTDSEKLRKMRIRPGKVKPNLSWCRKLKTGIPRFHKEIKYFNRTSAPLLRNDAPGFEFAGTFGVGEILSKCALFGIRPHQIRFDNYAAFIKGNSRKPARFGFFARRTHQTSRRSLCRMVKYFFILAGQRRFDAFADGFKIWGFYIGSRRNGKVWRFYKKRLFQSFAGDKRKQQRKLFCSRRCNCGNRM